MNCKIVQDLAELYMERLVSAESAQAIREHLKSCPDCRQYYRSQKRPDVSVSKTLLPSRHLWAGTDIPSAETEYRALSNRLWKRHLWQIIGTSAALGAGSVMLAAGIIMTCRFGTKRLKAQR